MKMFNLRTAGNAMLVSLVTILGQTGKVKAQSGDYEYARGLVEIDTSAFPTIDLLERLANRLENSTNRDAKLEGMMVRAALLRRQASFGSEERKQELLTQARALYTKFGTEGKGHRLLEESVKQLEDIELEFADVTARQALADPQKSGALKEALGVFKRVADKKFADAEKYKPAFQKAMKDIGDFFDKNPDAESATPALIQAADKALRDYIPRDKEYVLSRLREIEAQPVASRGPSADELIKYCEAKIESEEMAQLEDVAMWYNFIVGRIHSGMLKEKKATEAWTEALNVNLDQFPPEVKKSAFDIKKLIVRDVVKMKMRAAEADPKKYNEVANIVSSVMLEKVMKDMFDEPLGKDILIDYAHALVKHPDADIHDFEKSIKSLQDIVRKGPPWSNNASRKMAEVLGIAQRKRIRPRLTASAWFSTARGFFMEGQRAYQKYREAENAKNEERARQEYANASEQYRDAVEYYRRAIGRARNPAVTNLSERLEIEPQAWFEMGLSYLKIKHYYEAIIAFNAIRTTFMPDFRKRWMPDPRQNAQIYKDQKIVQLLDDLDRVLPNNPTKNGLLNRTEKNIVIALNLNRQANKSIWDQQLVARIMDEGIVAEGTSNNVNFNAGKASMDAAKSLIDQGREFAKSKSAEEKKKAGQQYKEAVDKYLDAISKFARVEKDSDAWEMAHYQVTVCYSFILQLVNERNTPFLKPEEAAEQNKQFAAKMLESIDAYFKAATGEPKDEKSANLRKRYGRGVLLSKMSTHRRLEDWENLIKSAEEYIAFEAKYPPPAGEERTGTAYFNKFIAISAIAGDQDPPECDKMLAHAETLLEKLQSNERDYGFAIKNLTARYNNAAIRAQSAGLGNDVVLRYNERVAHYTKVAMQGPDADDKNFMDYGRLLYIMEQSKKYREAADIAIKMIGKFDPENRNARIDDKKWPLLLQSMYKIIRYDDLNKWDSCKKEHMTMLDFVYDDKNAGLRFGHDPNKSPEHDRFPANPEKALERLKSIRTSYPDCATVKPTKPEHFYEGKSYLDYIEEEIEFRRRIVATRDLLAEMALKTADDLTAQNDEDGAKVYRTAADEQIQVLLKIYGNVPEMKLKSASIREVNGDYQKALEMLWDVKNSEPDRSSDLYSKSSVRISQVYAKMGDWKNASTYPLFVNATIGLDSPWAKKYWPDVKEFLEKCYANGIPRPAELKTADNNLSSYYKMKTPFEEELEKMEHTFRNSRNHDAGFLMRYNVLKNMVNNSNEFVLMEKIYIKYEQREDKDKVISEAFKKRYDLLKELLTLERQAWDAIHAYDNAVVNRGGVRNVDPELLKKRNELVEKVSGMNEQLSKMETFKDPETL